MGFTAFPTCEHYLMLFATSSHKSLAYKTFKVYLAGIQHFATIWNWPFKMLGMQRLYLTLRGIRRIQGNSFTRPLRAPITIPLLFRLHQYLADKFSLVNYLMLKAASLVAFFGLLRSSEYLGETVKNTTENTLLFSDVTFAPGHSHMDIQIKKSKTDPFRQGYTLRLWSIHNSNLCPVRASLNYYLLSTQVGPVFQFEDESLLTRARLSSIIQQALPGINLNTHSFRIGGASTAHAAGIPDSTIQALGRWSSDAYRIYLRIPSKTIQQTFTKMSQMTSTCDSWYPYTNEELRDGKEEEGLEGSGNLKHGVDEE